MEEKLEFIKQLCSSQLYNDEDFCKAMKEKWPLIDPNSGWKNDYFDLSEKLYEIKHPQAHDISKILYSSIFDSSAREENMKILNEVFIVLSKNPLDYISVIY